MLLGMIRRLIRPLAHGRGRLPDPRVDAVALKLAGNQCLARRDLAGAERRYREALVLDPSYGEALNNLGCVLKDQGRTAEAEHALQAAIAANPQLKEAFKNLGDLYRSQNHLADAELAYRRCLEVAPDFAEAHNALGVVLNQRGCFAEAEAAYRRALRLEPDHSAATDNLGTLMTERGREGEAERLYRDALARFPQDAELNFLFSLFLLRLGRFEEGWERHEARYDPRVKDPVSPLPTVDYPQWRGERLSGKSLLVWYEQGYGDQIQFCRFLPLLKRAGASHLTLVCRHELLALFETLEGVDKVVSAEHASNQPRHDYWVLPLSIPLHLRTSLSTIPSELPYLRAMSDRIARWRPRLPSGGPRVGLVWKGNSRHNNDINRSLPGLATLEPLWKVAGVSFVSLQMGAGEHWKRDAPQALVDLGSDIRDFADSAAIISQLDLIICIDTAVAHLAGALGKPCWLLLPYIGTDWRWLRGRNDSPWYPVIMKLFRQPGPEDWSVVIDEVARALHNQFGRLHAWQPD